MPKADFAIVGLGVMGQNLALNMCDQGLSVAVFNNYGYKPQEMVDKNPGMKLIAANTPQELADALTKPRRILMMMKAGSVTDKAIETLRPVLEPGDILIDGGNSLFDDTERREKDLATSGIKFFGMGVSGGEEGARYGPALMPGGDRESYEHLKPVLEAIAAKAPSDNKPCVTYCGERGAGHFVKMVHNGIEYGDMQLIAEAYDLLKTAGGFDNVELARIFEDWNHTELESFLIETTHKVINFPDPNDPSRPLVEQIRDVAGMKGTGTWTIQSALNLLIPVPTMAAAVDSREISAMKDQREIASTTLAGPTPGRHPDAGKQSFIDDVRAALYCSKICSYAQGMTLLAGANKPKDGNGFDFKIPVTNIPQIWRAGCIIRAVFLEEITQAYTKNPGLPNLLMDDKFTAMLASRQDAWRRITKLGIDYGISLPAFTGSLAYYDAYRRARMPANLIQAQRDYFGAHTYERTDAPGTFIHTTWAQEQPHNTPPKNAHGATQVGTTKQPVGD